MKGQFATARVLLNKIRHEYYPTLASNLEASQQALNICSWSNDLHLLYTADLHTSLPVLLSSTIARSKQMWDYTGRFVSVWDICLKSVHCRYLSCQQPKDSLFALKAMLSQWFMSILRLLSSGKGGRGAF